MLCTYRETDGNPAVVLLAYLATVLPCNTVDVQAGNQTANEYAQPVLWGWLDARDRELWPALLRGDVAHGSENMMKEAEARKLPYLFKLKRSPGVLKLIAELGAKKAGWQEAGGHWKGIESSIRLQGWSRERRVIVLRRKVGAAPMSFEDLEPGNEQMVLPGLE